MTKTLPEALHELGDDQGRELPATGAQIVQRGRRLRLRRRAAGVVAAMAVFATAASVVTLRGPAEDNIQTAAGPREVWERAASIPSAYDQGAYTLTTSTELIRAAEGSPLSYSYTKTSEAWFPRDRSKPLVARIGEGAPYVFQNAEEETRARAAGLFSRVGPVRSRSVQGLQTIGINGVGSQIDWAVMPRDPQALALWFRNLLGPSPRAEGDPRVFALLMEAALMPEIPADAKVGVLKAIAGLRDVTFEENFRLAGFTGVAAISGVDTVTHKRRTLLLDPRTGRPLAAETRTYPPSSQTPGGDPHTVTIGPADSAPEPEPTPGN